MGSSLTISLFIQPTKPRAVTRSNIAAFQATAQYHKTLLSSLQITPFRAQHLWAEACLHLPPPGTVGRVKNPPPLPLQQHFSEVPPSSTGRAAPQIGPGSWGPAMGQSPSTR